MKIVYVIKYLSSNNKNYIRGNDKYYFGNRLYTFATELYFPLTKNLNIGWPDKMVAFNHFGISLFVDGAYIWKNNKIKDAEEILRKGIELKANFSFLSDLTLYTGISYNSIEPDENQNYYIGIKTFMPF